ncbi:MAG TPA: hypothetical protein VGD61_12520 [Pyrinomonadaceae bacterium]
MYVYSGEERGIITYRCAKPSTINRELEILSKIFSLAIEYGVTYTNRSIGVLLAPGFEIVGAAGG